MKEQVGREFAEGFTQRNDQIRFQRVSDLSLLSLVLSDDEKELPLTGQIGTISTRHRDKIEFTASVIKHRSDAMNSVVAEGAELVGGELAVETLKISNVILFLLSLFDAC
jgi:hypothetical protein